MAASLPGHVSSLGLLLGLFSALFPTAIHGCALSIGSCTPLKCSALATLTSAVKNVPAQYSYPYFNNANNYGDKQMGWFAGITNVNPATWVNSSRGGAYINWEVYPYLGTGSEAGFLVTYANVSSLVDCCNLCATTSGCSVYQWFQGTTLSNSYSVLGVKGASGLKWPTGYVANNNCYLLSGGSINESATYGTPEGWVVSSPYTGLHSKQISTYASIVPAWVGGHCNPFSSVSGDPHFVGARGTRFEFNGAIDKTFALISDERLHVNMKLGGYEDPRTQGATLIQNGKAIRTWIRELGFVWLDQNGAKHTLVMKCRTGPSQELGLGYIIFMALDGSDIAVPAIEDMEMHQYAAGFSLKRTSVVKKGYFFVEEVDFKLDGILDLKLDLRPAHPLLQTTTDAYVHFSVQMEPFKPSPKVHGVLGQTFRQSSEQTKKALEYKLLASLMKEPIAADAASGKGFLDGEPKDYQVADLLSTDFKFSAFAK